MLQNTIITLDSHASVSESSPPTTQNLSIHPRFPFNGGCNLLRHTPSSFLPELCLHRISNASLLTPVLRSSLACSCRPSRSRRRRRGPSSPRNPPRRSSPFSGGSHSRASFATSSSADPKLNFSPKLQIRCTST